MLLTNIKKILKFDNFQRFTNYVERDSRFKVLISYIFCSILLGHVVACEDALKPIDYVRERITQLRSIQSQLEQCIESQCFQKHSQTIDKLFADNVGIQVKAESKYLSVYQTCLDMSTCLIESYQEIYKTLEQEPTFTNCSLALIQLSDIMACQYDEASVVSNAFHQKHWRMMGIQEDKFVRRVKNLVVESFQEDDARYSRSMLRNIDDYIRSHYFHRLATKVADCELVITVGEEIEAEKKRYHITRRRIKAFGVSLPFSPKVQEVLIEVELLKDALLPQFGKEDIPAQSIQIALKFVVAVLPCLSVLRMENMNLEKELDTIQISHAYQLQKDNRKKVSRRRQTTLRQNPDQESVSHMHATVPEINTGRALEPLTSEEEDLMDHVHNCTVVSQRSYDKLWPRICNTARSILGIRDVENLDCTPRVVFNSSRLYVLLESIMDGEQVKHNAFLEALECFAQKGKRFGAKVTSASGSRLKLCGPKITHGLHRRHGGADPNPSLQKNDWIVVNVLSWLEQWGISFEKRNIPTTFSPDDNF